MTWKRESKGRYTSGDYLIRRTWRGEEVRWLLLLSGTQVDDAPTLAGAKRFADRREGLEVETGHTRPCTRRCDNGSVRLPSGLPAVCPTCSGRGRVASAADRDETERARRVAALLAQLNDAAALRGDQVAAAVHDARALLFELEPARHDKMLESLDAGRFAAVVDALIAYGAMRAARRRLTVGTSA
jgi:hypothetical protein